MTNVDTMQQNYSAFGKRPVLGRFTQNQQQTGAASEQVDPSPSDPFRDVPPAYVGHIKLLRWGNTSNSGMTVTCELLDVDTTGSHPFKGLRAARASKTEGQRMKTVIMLPEDLAGDREPQVYTGDAILVWWAEDCAEGMKATLRIDEGVDGANFVHPCDGMSTGRKDGEILHVVAWTLDDEDLPDAPKAKKSRRSFEDLPATTQSHILCRDSRFFHWLVERENFFVRDAIVCQSLQGLKTTSQEKYCESVVKIWCGIESRAEFNAQGESADHAKARWQKVVDAYQRHRWGDPR